MRQWQTWNVHVILPDGLEEVIGPVGGLHEGVVIADEQLNLYYLPGEMADLQHVWSFPLASIRRWRKART